MESDRETYKKLNEILSAKHKETMLTEGLDEKTAEKNAKNAPERPEKRKRGRPKKSEIQAKSVETVEAVEKAAEPVEIKPEETPAAQWLNTADREDCPERRKFAL